MSGHEKRYRSEEIAPTVTLFHSHPANVVDEQFGKCDGEKYEIAAWEKYL